MQILEKLFERHFQRPPTHVKPLQGALGGSGRFILRLTAADVSAIGILYGVREENVAFLSFSKHFRRHGLPVPEIYEEDLSQGAYLEQDLGDTSLFEFLQKHRKGEEVEPRAIEAYRASIGYLPQFQVTAGRDLDYRVCYPRSSFDRQSIAWDLNYFKYYFLRLAEIAFNEQDLERDFNRLTKFLLTTDRDYFLYRDFQSRNIMLQNMQPYFVDYQGGRKGALQYDIASLLYDAKADLPPNVRQELLDYYLQRLSEFIPLDRENFMRYYYAYVYVRLMQALGAYGFRGFYERKPHFLQSVPYALKNLRWLLHNVRLPIELPTLLGAFQGMLGSETLLNLSTESGSGKSSTQTTPTAQLTVRIFSFSFHRDGLPKDESGNGGGFVFDARAVPNPGREDRFKALTGKDPAVIEYIQQQKEARDFLTHTTALVDAAADNYLHRGFSNLMVSFGCTGGQHRSVFFAESLAKHLSQRPNVRVILRHIELEKMGR